MPPIVLVLLAGAAVLHVLWNVLLKTSADPLPVSARAVGWGTIVSAPLAAAAWWSSGRPTPPTETLGLAVASAVVELGYFNFLSAAYRRGDLSVVYPIARGSAPVVAVALGLFVLGERLDTIAYFGIVLLLAGIWLVWRPAEGTTRRPAVGYALLTGLTIAIYSAIDRLGVESAPPWLYAWMLWLFTALLLQAWVHLPFVAATEIGRGPETGRGPVGKRALVVGVAMVGAWFLVLVSLSLAPLALVSPLRESAIVLATLWGVVRLRERRGAASRLLGASAIVVGVVVVAAA